MLCSPPFLDGGNILRDELTNFDGICKFLFYELISAAVEKAAKDAIFPISQNHGHVHLYYLPPI